MIIRLEQVLDAIETADDAFTYFFDTQTGETVFLSDPMITGESYEELEELIESSGDRFLRFPTKYDIHEYSIMENFVYSLSAITGWNNCVMIIGIRHIGRSPSAGAGMRGLNIPRKIKHGGMAATDAVIPPLYFLRVDQLMKNDFLCPVTDIVHMAHPFHLVRCF